MFQNILIGRLCEYLNEQPGEVLLDNLTEAKVQEQMATICQKEGLNAITEYRFDGGRCDVVLSNIPFSRDEPEKASHWIELKLSWTEMLGNWTDAWRSPAKFLGDDAQFKKDVKHLASIKARYPNQNAWLIVVMETEQPFQDDDVTVIKGKLTPGQVVKVISLWTGSNPVEHQIISRDKTNCHILLWDIDRFNDVIYLREGNKYVLK